MELPAVATRVGGVPEVIDDGHTGMLFDYPDVEAGAQKLSQLAHDEVLRRGIGKMARTSICSRFGVDAMADRFLAFYSRITRNDDR